MSSYFWPLAATINTILKNLISVTPDRENIVKTLKCDLCDHEASGETFEAWMEALKPHYGAAHADVMQDSSKTEEDMKNWMAENKTRFDAA